MKQCPTCNMQLEDNAQFCPNCGTRMEQPRPVENYTQPVLQPVVDPYDHTSEFDAKDVSDSKVIAMLVYLLDIAGIIVALLAAKDSPYAGFHIRQALKFTVVEVLVGIIAVVLGWTVIVPVICMILLVLLVILKLVCFFQICSGKAVEPYVIRNLSFLR